MEERVYKSIRGAGTGNIVLGVLTIAGGITTGVLMIITGGKLLHNKSKMLF